MGLSGTLIRTCSLFNPEVSPSQVRSVFAEISRQDRRRLERILFILEQYQLAPAFYCLLRDSHAEDFLPGEWREYLSRLYLENLERNRLLKHQLLEIVRNLNGVGIRPALLKGMAHQFSSLYADPGFRMIGDLDLLIPREKRLLCLSELRRLGYAGLTVIAEYAKGLTGEKLADMLRNTPHFFPLTKEGEPGELEIHTQLWDSSHSSLFVLSADEVFRKARPTAIAEGAVILQLSPLHTLSHNVLHSYMHYLSCRFLDPIAMKQALDFVLLSRRHSHNRDRDSLRKDLLAQEASAVLRHQEMLIQRFFPPPSGSPAPQSLQEKVRLKRILFHMTHDAAGRMEALTFICLVKGFHAVRQLLGSRKGSGSFSPKKMRADLKYFLRRYRRMKRKRSA